MQFRTILLVCVVAGLLCGQPAGADEAERAAAPTVSFGVIADVLTSIEFDEDRENRTIESTVPK